MQETNLFIDSNFSKMNKQEFIDKTPSNDLEKITQILLERCSKTKITQLKRTLGEILQLCQKTWMHETGLKTYHDALTKCEQLNNPEDQLES